MTPPFTAEPTLGSLFVSMPAANRTEPRSWPPAGLR